jgi:hypothetical protein
MFSLRYLTTCKATSPSKQCFPDMRLADINNFGIHDKGKKMEMKCSTGEHIVVQ